MGRNAAKQHDTTSVSKHSTTQHKPTEVGKTQHFSTQHNTNQHTTAHDTTSTPQYSHNTKQDIRIKQNTAFLCTT